MPFRRSSIVTTTTFSKWTPELAALVPAGARLVLCGVSTDCCVLTTALASNAPGEMDFYATSRSGTLYADHYGPTPSSTPGLAFCH